MSAAGSNLWPLSGKRVCLLGTFASMSRREVGQLVKHHGGVLVAQPSPTVNIIIVGEGTLPLGEGEELDDWLDPATRQAVEDGTIEIVTETQLFQRVGLVDQQPDIHRLYTPAMLARLLNVPVAIVRRWHRRGLIVPVVEVRRLPYFDFQEVATARRLAQLLAAGVSPREIEKKLSALAKYLPNVTRPLAQLSVIIEGRQILLRQGDGLIEPGGQLRFDFGADADIGQQTAARAEAAGATPVQPETICLPTTPEQLCRMAAELEDDGQLTAAAEMYRAAMAAGGPTPQICFQLAELLYRLGELPAARERYYMAIELDEDFVEARANLGCVLAEMGQLDLAIAAFQGALKYHPDYADVHYHLARILEELGRPAEARQHWQHFLAYAPDDSPWSEEARLRLGGCAD